MIRQIGPKEAQALIAGGIDVVDVRSPAEFSEGHLPHARLVPLAEFRANPAAVTLPDRVLFVCATGRRSVTASELAATRGVPEIYNLEGGTAGWEAAGLPIELSPSPPSIRAAAAAAVASASAQATGSQEHADDSDADARSNPELDAVVAENVRQLRADRGWTLDILAGASGVGRQTLGQVELGRSVPSLGTLWKIARAFDVPFSTLMARPQTFTTRVLRTSDAKRLVSADGRFSSRALFTADDASKSRVEFYELWLAGHGRDDAEPHAPGTRENLVVTGGRLVLEVGGDRYELAKGDAIAFIADVPHAYVNPGSEDCWMNLVMTYQG